MPELPEVEIVRQSLDKKIKGKIIKKVIVKNRNLRFKVPLGFEDFLKDQKFSNPLKNIYYKGAQSRNRRLKPSNHSGQYG